MDLSEFSSLRPLLFHLTAAENLDRIRADSKLLSAATLLLSAHRGDLLSERRREHVAIMTRGARVHIRDQRPLHSGAIEFQSGWDLARLVAELNQHVFFWPGSLRGPVESGRNHFSRYQSEGPVILRAPTWSLLGANARRVPLFACVNSGAPRCSRGRRSPRGESTFCDALTFSRTASSVVEVVFRDSVAVPRGTEVASSPHGPWRPLF